MEATKMFVIRKMVGESVIPVRNLIFVHGSSIEECTAEHVLKKYLSSFNSDTSYMPVAYNAEKKFATYKDPYGATEECEEITNIHTYHTSEVLFYHKDTIRLREESYRGLSNEAKS